MLTREMLTVRRHDEASAFAVVQRVDRYELRLDASSIETPPNMPGVVDVWGVATRVGVFVYDDDERPGDILREWRPPDEVLDRASLASLVGVPFTIDHPPSGVDSASWRDLAHGHVLEVRVDGDLVLAKIRIGSDEAQRVIKAGKVELSCGYVARLDETRGITPAGEVFDAVQREIRYNHLALVDLARAGHVARLHLDAHGARVQRVDQARRTQTTGSHMLIKLKIDGKTHTIPALLVPGISAKADETAAKKRRGDAIETAAVSLETPDGPVDLVLPASAVDEILAMIGATPAAGSVEPEIEPAPMPEAGGDEAGAPGPGGDTPPDDELGRMDGAKLLERIDAAVAKAVAVAVPKVLKARDDRAAERGALERRCGPHLVSGYRFDEASDLDLIVDTIEAVVPERHDDAKSLAERAKKGDERARGRLDAMLDGALEQDRNDSDDTGRAMGAVFSMRREESDRADAAQATGVPRHVKARQARIDRVSGNAKTDKAAG